MIRRAIFPGTFDPFTRGHASVVRRALQLVDEVVIGLGVSHEGKVTREAVEQRLAAIRAVYKDEPRVRVEAYSCLTVDFARQVEAAFIVRGVRSARDFEYEQPIADINRRMGVETLLLFSEPEYASLSSTIVRELMKYGKDVSEYLP